MRRAPFALLVGLAALLCGGGVLAQHPPAPADPTPELAGRWLNEAGSEMTLAVDGRRLDGRFRNAAGAARGAAGYPIRGWLNGDLLAFCVDWGAPLDGAAGAGVSSVSCFVGQHSIDERGPFLKTQWHVSRNVADPAEVEDLWGSVLTGADVFRPPPPPPVSAPDAR